MKNDIRFILLLMALKAIIYVNATPDHTKNWKLENASYPHARNGYEKAKSDHAIGLGSVITGSICLVISVPILLGWAVFLHSPVRANRNPVLTEGINASGTMGWIIGLLVAYTLLYT